MEGYQSNMRNESLSATYLLEHDQRSLCHDDHRCFVKARHLRVFQVQSFNANPVALLDDVVNDALLSFVLPDQNLNSIAFEEQLRHRLYHLSEILLSNLVELLEFIGPGSVDVVLEIVVGSFDYLWMEMKT